MVSDPGVSKPPAKSLTNSVRESDCQDDSVPGRMEDYSVNVGSSRMESEDQVPGRRPGDENASEEADEKETELPVYRVLESKLINVRMGEDNNRCDITGICAIPGGALVIVDIENCRLKLLDKMFKIVSSLELPQYPRSVCAFGDKEVAVVVSEGEKQEVHFINVQHDKLAKRSVLALSNQCCTLAFDGQNLYVGSVNSVYVYSKSGRFEKELIQSEEYVINCVSVHKDCSFLCVTDFANDCLYVFNKKNGSLLSKCDHADIIMPTWVSIVRSNTAFVCGKDSHLVVQLDITKSEVVNTIASEKEGVSHPNCLCFDDTTQRLAIGQWSDNILILKLGL